MDEHFPPESRIFYHLVGRVAVPTRDIEVWGRMFEDHASRVVRAEAIGTLIVSTVFIGIDLNFRLTEDRTPLLFETVIRGAGQNSYQARCATWDQAERQHEEAVVIATAQASTVQAIELAAYASLGAPEDKAS